MPTTNFPTSLDDNSSLPNPGSGSITNNPSHAGQHDIVNDAVKALEAKMGIGASTPSSGKVFRGTSSGVSSWGPVDLTTDVTGVLPQANGGTGTGSATGTGSVVYQTSPTINSPTLSTPTLTNPTINSASLANLTSLFSLIYPIGCIYTETTGTNPGTTFGMGTWSAYGQGRVLAGFSSGDPDFGTPGGTGGASTHWHWQTTGSDAGSSYLEIAGSGSGQSRVTTLSRVVINTTANSVGAIREDGTYTASSLQPFITVYFWRRTA